MARSVGRYNLVVQLLPPLIILAIAMLALRSSTAVWASLVATASGVAPLAMTLAAVFGDRVRRPFRGGFAICSGSYYLLWFVASAAPIAIISEPGDPLTSFQSLATTKVVDYLHDKVFFCTSTVHLLPDPIDTSQRPPGGGAFDTKPESSEKPPSADSKAAPAAKPTAPAVATPSMNSFQAPSTPDDSDRAENFELIGQCLWAWLLGWSGGQFAQWMARRRVVDSGPNSSVPA